MYPPILDTFDNPQYVYVNQTLIIPIGFLAKPMPQIEDITWQILALNDGFGHILQPGDEEANFNVKLPLVNGNRMLTSLVIQNITSDLNITLTIRNEIDELRHEMFVLYQPPVAYQGNDIITTGDFNQLSIANYMYVIRIFFLRNPILDFHSDSPWNHIIGYLLYFYLLCNQEIQETRTRCSF